MKKIILFLVTTFFMNAVVKSQTNVWDYDGNIYSTVTIGSQMWLVQNLRVTHFNNGDSIPYVTDNTDWYNTTTPALAWYNHSSTNHEIYGNLYNGYVMTDTRNVCPVGWHIPNENEWVELERTVCSSATCITDFPYDSLGQGWQGSNEGAKLKEVGTTHWNSPNSGTNSSGFTALPAGYRYWDGDFYTLNQYTVLWSKTKNSDSLNWMFHGIVFDRSDIYKGYGDLKNGNSIRCMKPATGGMNDHGLNTIQISPNPTNDFIAIRIENTSNAEFEIFNIMGQRMMSATIEQSSYTADVSHFAKGIYLVKILIDDNVVVKRFVKE
ncbi:MAG: FISUMP domain-containing protein [Bacteroidota bacterium]